MSDDPTNAIDTKLESPPDYAERETDSFATVALATEDDAQSVRFRVLRPHARGGLGEVFVASDSELPREVALKRIQTRHADQADNRARFVREAKITGALEHPSIVPVYGLGAYADGSPFYAMRFIRGESLEEAIQSFYEADANKSQADRSLEFRVLLHRFISVCNAIDYAHSRGVLHRDLKPSNIMLGSYGETFVVDWGLAKTTGPDVAAPTPGSAEKSMSSTVGGNAAPTQYGRVMGTPSYMSPEQAAGQLDDLAPSSDIYGLGATLYHLLTGRPPLEGADNCELLRKAQRGVIKAPRQVRNDVAAALEAICLKAMAMRPQGRYASARAVADDIERWLADAPVSVFRESLLIRFGRWSRRHRTLIAGSMAMLATTVVACSVGLVAIGLEQRETDRQRQLAVDGWATAEVSQRQATTERDRAIAAEAMVKVDRDRAVVAESQARVDRDRAIAAEAQAKVDRDRAVAAEAQARVDRDRAVVAEQRMSKDRDIAIQDANDAKKGKNLAEEQKIQAEVLARDEREARERAQHDVERLRNNLVENAKEREAMLRALNSLGPDVRTAIENIRRQEDRIMKLQIEVEELRKKSEK